MGLEQTADGRSTASALLERQELLERLTRVQRSIPHGAPIAEVLDAVAHGAQQLLGDGVVSLRLIDEDDPSHSVIASVCGLSDDVRAALHRMPVGDGAGGRAITENRLVVMQDYARSPYAFGVLVEEGLRAAMAAPLHEQGEVVGSLAVASYDPDRDYSEGDQAALVAFAQHASLALTDARAIDALREAQRSKEMFLATVSHELKSPLTVILGTLYTLRRHHLSVSDDVRDEMLSSAHERANELAALVNRVLEGARAELAAVEEEILLSDLIRSSLRGFDHAKSLFVSDIPETTVIVDPGAVRQVIGILLENAVSHSEAEDRVTVESEVDSSTVTIAVVNKGSIAEEDLPSLFEPFSRGSKASSKGVGLGLYIASRLASAIGGDLEAESGGGLVRFSLHFPLKTSADDDLGPTS